MLQDRIATCVEMRLMQIALNAQFQGILQSDAPSTPQANELLSFDERE
jgi:hypothetical protein